MVETASLARYGDIAYGNYEVAQKNESSNHSGYRLVRGHFRWCSGVVVLTTLGTLRRIAQNAEYSPEELTDIFTEK
jgi:hypothetical protein